MASGNSSSRSEYHKDYNRLYRKTPKGAAIGAWSRLCARVGSGRRYYAHVEVRMTRAEFMAWAVPLYEKWFSEHPAERPSVDRIRSEGHYEIGNIQIISLGDNSRKSRSPTNINVQRAPDGTKWCSSCAAFLPLDAFYRFRPTKSSPLGCSVYCKPHTLERQKARRGPVRHRLPSIIGINKWCPRCQKLVPIAEFRKGSGTQGLYGYCTKCANARKRKRPWAPGRGATPGVDKWCPKCQALRPVAEFSSGNGSQGLFGYCKSHQAEQDRAARAKRRAAQT